MKLFKKEQKLEPQTGGKKFKKTKKNRRRKENETF